MPGRHLRPRHKAPRSISRSVTRLAGDVAGAAPQATTAVAVVGAAGVALGVGYMTAAPGTPRPGSADASTSTQAGLVTDLGRSDEDEDEGETSRSGARPVLASVQRKAKTEALSVNGQSMSGVDEVTVAPTDPKEIALSMLPDYGWTVTEMTCLDELWYRESNWNYQATNPYSGAYGIPQSLPASKMATAGTDYLTNPATQITWGLTYIQDRYGSPCGAWSFWTANSYY